MEWVRAGQRLAAAEANKAGEVPKCIRYRGKWDPTGFLEPRGPMGCGVSTPNPSSGHHNKEVYEMLSIKRPTMSRHQG